MTLSVPADINIAKLSGRLMIKLRNHLDTAPESQNWRALVALLKQPYIFKQTDVEKFAMQIYGNRSPAEQLLMALSSRGMKVKDLVYYLDKLRLEKILKELKNYEPIKVTEQPVFLQKLKEGEKFTLVVQATGFPYPRYQWFCDQQAVTGAIDSTLAINGVSEHDAGHYCCRLHNSACAKDVVFSEYAELKVYSKVLNLGVGTQSYPSVTKQIKAVPDQKVANDECFLPVITSHPRDSFIFNGSTFYLTCETKGKGPLRYTWVYEDSRFFAETSIPILQVDNAGQNHTGRYRCHVKNDYGEAISIPAMITVAPNYQPIVDPRPRIQIQPMGCRVVYGENAIFTCEAVGNELEYQWFQNSLPLQGQTRPQLFLLSVRTNAIIHCQVSNMVGYICSQKVILEVIASMYQSASRYTATDKVALLIGNYNYRCDNPLKAPKSDIQVLGDVFRSLDFKVVSLLNLTLNEMKSAVQMFCDLLGEGVYAVFYFCGHGFEEKGQCYFVPEDAQTDFSEKDCLCANTVLGSMQLRGPKHCTMILDICRKENKNGSDGSVEGQGMPNLTSGNCFICYATCVGLSAYEVGDTGILVKHLQKHLRQPIKIEDVFSAMREDMGQDEKVKEKQIPEVRTNMLEPARSYCDPIHYRNGGTQAFNRRVLAWENAHKLPDQMVLSADFGIVLLLEFQSNFSNVLEVFITVQNKGDTEDCIAWITHIPTTVSVIESPSQVMEGKTKNLIQDIQKLKNDLVVNLAIKYRLYDGKHTMLYKKHVNLGFPLVAKLKLWAPKLQKLQLREPTEQAEEVESPTAVSP